MHKYLVLAMLLALPAPASAGVKVEVGPGVEVQHHNGGGYERNQCYERGGYWRHGHCNFSRRHYRERRYHDQDSND